MDVPRIKSKTNYRFQYSTGDKGGVNARGRGAESYS
jgi:hypothetical protein